MTRITPDRLDLYGKRTVYEGLPKLSGEHRYLVWYGGESSKRDWPRTYRTLRFAVRRAKSLQNQGYHVRISDRLIQEGDDRVTPITESHRYKGQE